MKLGLLAVLALMIGSVVTHFMLENNGYVLINFLGYTLEMSVPILILIFILFYLGVRLLVWIWRAPRELGEMTARAKMKRSSRQIRQGFVALSEGKLARGEKLLTKGAASSEAPVLNYLAAARAAQMQGDHDRRDGWLKMAYEQDSGASNAVLLTQAELQLANGEYEQARACLNRVQESHPQHSQALKLLAELHYAEHDWPALTNLLPALRRTKNVPSKQLAAWTIEAYRERLSADDLNRVKIDQYWQELPRGLRKEMSLIRARVTALIACGEIAPADAEIRKALKAGWDDELVNLYGQIRLADSDEQLRQVESWLNKRPEDPVLLLTAGRACMRNQLWGKARSYLESSLAIRSTPAAYNELGQLMLQMDEPRAATTAFAKGLSLSNTAASGAPRLQRDR